jgi:hypothetical protein
MRRVGRAPCDAGPPSEPDVPVSEHPAQASPDGSGDVTSYDPLVGSVSSAGPFAATIVVASNLSVGAGVIIIFAFWAHLTASAPFRAGPPGPVSGQLSETTRWRGGPSRPGFLPPFGYRHSLLGHPIPAGEFRPPHGRPTGQTAGPRRGYHVPHARVATGLGALCTPRTTVLVLAGARPQPASAAFSTASPCTPPQQPTMRSSPSRGINESSSNSPVRSSPRLWPPDGTGTPWAFPRASHPADQEPDDARRGGDRPPSTDLEQRSRHIRRTSNLVFTRIVRPRVAPRVGGSSERSRTRRAVREKQVFPGASACVLCTRCMHVAVDRT